MKTLLTLFIVLFSISTFAQNQIDVSLHQDAKLLITGDGNNPALTPNIIARVDLQGMQEEYGYLVVGVEYEYAALDMPYHRYSANIGYTLNDLIVKDVEANIRGSYGMIVRENFTFGSYGLSGSLSYKLFNNFKLIALANLNYRPDKEAYYENAANYTIQDLKLDFSGFIGIGYTIKIH